MDEQEFKTLLEGEEFDINDLVNDFQSLTVEQFNELNADEQAVLEAVYQYADADLGETVLGKMFAERAEEQPTIVESMIVSALSGNIVETEALFAQALQERIANKWAEREETVRANMFATEEETLTMSQVMEAEELSLDDMIYVVENMDDAAFAALDQGEQDVVATFKEIFEKVEGDREALEVEINKNLLSKED